MNINLNSSSIEDINNFKNTLYGKNIKYMTQAEMYDLYKSLYDDRYYKNMDQLSKVQIRNRLVSRLNMTTTEKELERDTGINKDTIEQFVREVFTEVSKNDIDGLLTEEYLQYSIGFWQSFGISSLRDSYNDHYRDDKSLFDIGVRVLFDKDRMINFEIGKLIKKKKQIL